MTDCILGHQKLTIEDVAAIAKGSCSVALSTDRSYKQKIESGADCVKNQLEKEATIYGVTTGYGDSCTTDISNDLVYELPLHLTRYHGCGLGAYFNDEETLAILICRLASLAQGYSGVRWELLMQLTHLINHQILPQIPEEGSVGASGDLTPLSYVAAALIGERDVRVKGKVQSAKAALDRAGIAPIRLFPKEGLALMNGTAVMTALACLAYQRAQYLSKLSTRLTALVSLGLLGNASHFSPDLFKVKPHPGMIKVADCIWKDLAGYRAFQTENGDPSRLQDRYSIRCAPHVIGVVEDVLSSLRPTLEIELNSANDNPIIDPETQQILHGGHFYGGHIAYAMDTLKTVVANVADLMDRQMALLVDTKFNNGLPANLCGTDGDRARINHGFKAVQITMSACTAEALKLTMPASVFSRSTECHNQDKVSMGTIAARDCRRVVALTEQVAACLILAACQAIEIRVKKGELTPKVVGPLYNWVQSIHAEVPFITEDRPLEHELRALIQGIQDEKWDLA